MFEDMSLGELESLFRKIFVEYYEREKKFRETGKDIEPGDIQAGSEAWQDRFQESVEIVRMGGLLSDISRQIREKRK